MDKFREAAGDYGAGAIERRALACDSPCRAMDDRPGVAHGHAFASAAPGDQREHRLGKAALDDRYGKLLLLIPADFTDDDERVGILVSRKPGEKVGEPHAPHRVAANPHPQALSN